MLEGARFWQNEALFQVCAGADSQGMLRARRSSNARGFRAEGCVSARLHALQEGNGDSSGSAEEGEGQEGNGWARQDVYL